MFEEGRKIILMKSRPQLAVNRLIESKLPLATIQRRLSKLKSPSKFTPSEITTILPSILPFSKAIVFVRFLGYQSSDNFFDKYLL